jgi:hypothetical protein
MNPDKIVIRFEQVSEQTEGPVRRIVGFVRAKNMLQLFDAAGASRWPYSDEFSEAIREFRCGVRAILRSITPKIAGFCRSP